MRTRTRRIGSGLLKRGLPVREGRIKRQIRRAFIANGDKPLMVRDLRQWCYRGPRQRWRDWYITKVLRRLYVRVGRVKGQAGHPALWAPKG